MGAQALSTHFSIWLRVGGPDAQYFTSRLGLHNFARKMHTNAKRIPIPKRLPLTNWATRLLADSNGFSAVRCANLTAPLCLGVGLEPTTLAFLGMGYPALRFSSSLARMEFHHHHGAGSGNSLYLREPCHRVDPVPVVGVFPSPCDYSILQDGVNVNTFLKKNKKSFFQKPIDKRGQM